MAKRPGKGAGSGSGSGPGPRSGVAGGGDGSFEASLATLRSLMMPPRRCQVTPESLGWTQVCGTSLSGVWALKGVSRSFELRADLDDVGVVWESRSGYETAWATPGHDCLCSCSYGHGAVRSQANPSVFAEAVKLWSRFASLLTLWCAEGGIAIASVCSSTRVSRRSSSA